MSDLHVLVCPLPLLCQLGHNNCYIPGGLNDDGNFHTLTLNLLFQIDLNRMLDSGRLRRGMVTHFTYWDYSVLTGLFKASVIQVAGYAAMCLYPTFAWTPSWKHQKSPQKYGRFNTPANTASARASTSSNLWALRHVYRHNFGGNCWAPIELFRELLRENYNIKRKWKLSEGWSGILGEHESRVINKPFQ